MGLGLTLAFIITANVAGAKMLSYVLFESTIRSCFIFLQLTFITQTHYNCKMYNKRICCRFETAGILCLPNNIVLWLVSMGGNPGGGGGETEGDVTSPPPPRFWRWGTQYQMSPPPHVFVVGRFFVQICWPFFFLLVRMSDSDRRVPLICRKKNCQRRWRCEKKKVSESPPLISFFGSCATMGWRRPPPPP